jgi:hypothetical protein
LSGKLNSFVLEEGHEKKRDDVAGTTCGVWAEDPV